MTISKRKLCLDSFNKLGNEQKRIDKEIAELKDIVDEATKARKSARRSYDAALELATTLNLETAYLRAHPLMRRRLNQAMFSKIRIDDTNTVVVVGKFGPRKDHDVRVVGTEQQLKVNYQRLAEAVIGLTMSTDDCKP